MAGAVKGLLAVPVLLLLAAAPAAARSDPTDANSGCALAAVTVTYVRVTASIALPVQTAVCRRACALTIDLRCVWESRTGAPLGGRRDRGPRR